MSDHPPERPKLKTPRGPSSYIPEDGRAVLLYLALSEYNVSSNASRYGMPFVPGDRDGLLNLQATIGLALKDARKFEEKKLGKKLRYSRVEKRWRAYQKMNEARILIPDAEWRARLALWRLDKGGDMDELQTAEEILAQLNAVYYKNKKLNDRLRKGNLYLEVANHFLERLKDRGVKI